MTQIKVNYQYELLLTLLKKEMHQRELAKSLKTSLTRIQSILNELQGYSIVDFRTEGKNHVYFIKKSLLARTFILNAENYKLAKLIVKYPILEPLLKEAMQRSPNTLLLLFGSYAKFIPKDDSDIDLYIDTLDQKLKESIGRIDDRFSVKIGLFNKDDLLIKEIVANHVVVQGGDQLYEKLGFFG